MVPEKLVSYRVGLGKYASGSVARRGVDKNSLWAVLTPTGLRRFAPCPNSAVGSVCEPLNGSSPGWDSVRLEGGYCRSLSLVLMVPRRGKEVGYLK